MLKTILIVCGLLVAVNSAVAANNAKETPPNLLGPVKPGNRVNGESPAPDEIEFIKHLNGELPPLQEGKAPAVRVPSRATSFRGDMVGGAIMDPNKCSTTAVAGLAQQLIRTMECHANVQFAKISEVPDKMRFDPAVRAVPFLQARAAGGLKCLADKNPLGEPLLVNSAQRTLVQQLFLYRKYTNRLCRIPLAGEPHKSNHLSGAAVDIQQASRLATTRIPATCGWTYLGSADPVHFDYTAGGIKDIRKTAVWAFQRLWNRCRPAGTSALVEDGDWGPATENALMRSPAAGFQGCQVCPDDPKPAPPTSAPTAPTTGLNNGEGATTKPAPKPTAPVAPKPKPTAPVAPKPKPAAPVAPKPKAATTKPAAAGKAAPKKPAALPKI